MKPPVELKGIPPWRRPHRCGEENCIATATQMVCAVVSTIDRQAMCGRIGAHKSWVRTDIRGALHHSDVGSNGCGDRNPIT